MPSTEEIYWTGCVTILSIGGIALFICLSTFAYQQYQAKKHNKPKHHYILNASALMLIADVAMVVNFLPRDAYNLSIGHLDNSWWCEISAVVTISSFVGLSGGAVLIAHVTERTFALGVKANNKFSSQYLGIWTCTSWGIGITASLVFLFTNQIGPFKNIYCCTQNNGTPETSIPILFGFVASIASMSYIYSKAVWGVKSHVKAQDQIYEGKPGEKTTSVPTGVYTAPAVADLSVGGVCHKRNNSSQDDTNSNVVLNNTVDKMNIHEVDAFVHGDTTAQRGKVAQREAQRVAQRVALLSVDISGVGVGVGVSDHHENLKEKHSLPTFSNINNADDVAVHLKSVLENNDVELVDNQQQTDRGGAYLNGSTLEPPPSSPRRKISTGQQYVTSTSNQLVEAVSRKGKIMVMTFYCSWFLIAFDAFLALCGFNTNIWVAMIGAWMAKLQPLIDSCVLMTAMYKASRNRNIPDNKIINLTK